MTNPQLYACITLRCNILQGIKIWSLIQLKSEARGGVIRSRLFLSTAKIISSSDAAIIRMCNHYNKIFRDLTAWIWMRNKCHNTCCRVWSKRREQLEFGKKHTMVRSLVIRKVEIQHQVILIQLRWAKVIQNILENEEKRSKVKI